MPCYFVSSGVESPMTNETFDSIWNGFGNKELTDSETVFHRKKAMKQFHQSKSPKKNPMEKTGQQDDGYCNRRPKDETYFQRYYQEKTKQPCVCDICGCAMSCESNLARHKKTKKCQRFLV